MSTRERPESMAPGAARARCARARESVKLCASMQPRRITKADFDQIVEVIDRWWGGPISTFAHPIFFYELGDKALVVEDDGAHGGLPARLHRARSR